MNNNMNLRNILFDNKLTGSNFMDWVQILRVGNGARVAALAVGIYTLSLPNGLILDLKDCYFVSALTKNMISISCLDLDGFMIITKNKIVLYIVLMFFMVLVKLMVYIYLI